MQISDIPFGTTDWSTVPETVHPGETGTARWRTRQFGDIRVRVVEYSPAIWPITGARRGISSLCSTACCTPSLRTGAG